MANTEFDVAVVGGGPGGSAAARRCARGGLKAILLEKRQLPRNKVCTGMIMSQMCQTLIREEFGDPPPEALTRPSHLQGLKFRGPGAETLALEHRMPFAWRKDFDYWLNQRAKSAGVELWDQTRVKGVMEDKGGYTLVLERNGQEQWLKARFLIGADGALSVVRRILFPHAEMAYQLSVRCCYRATLDLEPEYVHYFYFPDLTGFEVNRKGDVFLLEVTPRPVERDGADIVRRAEEWLARDFGFPTGTRPLWRDGCFEPAMGRRPFSGDFPLANGNALLIGDAAGLAKPVTGEGIGTAIRSGLMAADAVIAASKGDGRASDLYTAVGQEMVATLGSINPPSGTIRREAMKGMDSFLGILLEIFSRSTKVL